MEQRHQITQSLPIPRYVIDRDVPGKIKCIGCGGTKTIYQIEDDICIAVPNAIDGRALAAEWPRIIGDEMEISQYLISLGLLHIPISKCIVKFVSATDCEYETIMMPTFASYARNNQYIMDSKNAESSTFPSDGSIQILPPEQMDDIDAWIRVFDSLFSDLRIMTKNCISPPGDAMNLIVIKNDRGDYHVRFFGFDFTSKRYAHRGFTDELYFSELVANMKKLLEFAIYTLRINPDGSMRDGNGQFYMKLAQEAVDRNLLGDDFIKDDGYEHKQVNNISYNRGCNVM
jgi:hypothetical protein